MLIFTWYRIDSRQRSYKRSPWLNISIFALALVAFPYYLFRSRGLKRGVIATVLFFVGTLAAGTISVAGQYAVWYVLQS